MTVDLDNVLYIMGFIITLSAVVGIVIKVVSNVIKKVTAETISGQIDQFTKIFNNQLSELSTSLVTHIGNDGDNTQIIKDCLLFMTRDKLNTAHQFYMAKGSIDNNSLCVLEDIYTSYKTLGGNSFIDSIMVDLRNLKIINYIVDRT